MDEETGVEHSLGTGFSTIKYDQMRLTTAVNVGTDADVGQ